MGPKATSILYGGGTKNAAPTSPEPVSDGSLSVAPDPLGHTDPAGEPSQPGSPQRVLRRSRIGSARTALIVSAVVLVLLLVFIVENGRSVKVSFLGASGHMPLGVAMLFAAIAGALLLAIPGTARIVQLRRAARRQHRQDVLR
jgi:uncharacterized integral membrane protein